MSEDHFYVFSFHGDDPRPVYERTVGDKHAARARCDELDATRGRRNSFYTINCLPDKWWY